MRIVSAWGLLALLAASVPISAQPTSPFGSFEADYGGAVPENIEEWFAPSDYPREAIRAGSEGRVIVSFEIGAGGRVSGCEVVEATNDSRLNSVPCRLLQSRARFTPATNAEGKPIPTRGAVNFDFFLN